MYPKLLKNVLAQLKITNKLTKIPFQNVAKLQTLPSRQISIASVVANSTKFNKVSGVIVHVLYIKKPKGLTKAQLVKMDSAYVGKLKWIKVKIALIMALKIR